MENAESLLPMSDSKPEIDQSLLNQGDTPISSMPER